jgi:hypothetical protein
MSNGPKTTLLALDPRRSLQTTRFHTWARHRDQSTGEHSMQVMRILLAIWPSAPRSLLVHCLRHDAGESTSGDPPYPIKVLNPDMKQACDRIESETVKLMETTWMFPSEEHQMTPLEKLVFKLAEFIEMWEWGLLELEMGNRTAQAVINNCVNGMIDYEHRLRTDYQQMQLAVDVLARARQYNEKRQSSHESIMNGGS